MKKIHPLELGIASAAFLTSWGLYLAVWFIALQEPLRQQFEEYFGSLINNNPHILSPHILISIIIGYVILQIVLGLWYHALAEANRRRDYKQWAKQHHWIYRPEEDKQLYLDLDFLYGIPGYEVRSSSSQKRFSCAIHTFEKTWPHYKAIAYTHYSRTTRRTGSGKNRQTKTVESFLSVTLIRIDHRFPKLYIRPLHWSDGLAKLLRLSQSKTVTPFIACE